MHDADNKESDQENIIDDNSSLLNNAINHQQKMQHSPPSG